jgi:hypothetical protein
MERGVSERPHVTSRVARTANVHLKRVESALEAERGRKADDLVIVIEVKASNSTFSVLLQ